MAEVVGKAPVTRKHRRVLWNAYTPPPAPSAPSTLPTLPPLPGTPPASSPANPSMSQPPQPSLRPHGCASLLLRPTGIPVLPEEDWPALAASGSSPFGALLRDGDNVRSWSIALDIFIASFSSLVEEDSNDDLHGIYLTGRREYSVGVTDFYGQRIYPDGSRLVGAFESGTGRFRAGARYFHNGGDEVDKTVLQLREPQFTHGRCAICGSVNPGCAHYSVPIRPHDCKTDLFARDLMGFSTNGIAILREKEALLEIEAKGQAVSDVACSWRSRGAAVYSDARAMLLDGLRNVVCGAPYLHFEKLSKNSAYLRIDIICRHLRKTPFFLAKFFKYYMDSREVPTTTRYFKQPADLTCAGLVIPVYLPRAPEHTWLSVVFEQPKEAAEKKKRSDKKRPTRINAHSLMSAALELLVRRFSSCRACLSMAVSYTTGEEEGAARDELHLHCHHCGACSSLWAEGPKQAGRNAKIIAAIEKRVLKLCRRVEHEKVSSLPPPDDNIVWFSDTSREAMERRKLEIQNERGSSSFFNY